MVAVCQDGCHDGVEMEVPVVGGKGEGSNMQKTSSKHTLPTI
jgi:hypothetical protein